jgi:hypothetical protein
MSASLSCVGVNVQSQAKEKEEGMNSMARDK